MFLEIFTMLLWIAGMVFCTLLMVRTVNERVPSYLDMFFVLMVVFLCVFGNVFCAIRLVQQLEKII